MSAGFFGKFKVNKIDMRENFALVRLGTFEEITYGERKGEFDWSNWTCKFVGDAFNELAGIKQGDYISIAGGSKRDAKISNVPRKDKNGEISEWNNPFVTVFQFSLAPRKSNDSKPKKGVSFT